VIGPHDRVFEKTVSNMQEVAARRGKIILVTDPKGAHEVHTDALAKLTLPAMPATATPLVYAIPVQLIAYHTAVVMGTRVDQPRTLAKSVTVECPDRDFRAYRRGRQGRIPSSPPDLTIGTSHDRA